MLPGGWIVKVPQTILITVHSLSTYTVFDFYVPYLFGFIHTFYIFFTISPYILDFQWEIICFCYEIIIFISVCASDGIFNLILSEGIFGFVLKS